MVRFDNQLIYLHIYSVSHIITVGTIEDLVGCYSILYSDYLLIIKGHSEVCGPYDHKRIAYCFGGFFDKRKLPKHL